MLFRSDVAERVGDPRLAANWVLGEFQAHLNADGITADASPVTPERLAGLVALVVDGTINQTSAKEVLAALVAIAAPHDGLPVVLPGLTAAVIAAGLVDVVILRLRHPRWEFPSGAVLTGMIVAMLVETRNAMMSDAPTTIPRKP